MNSKISFSITLATLTLIFIAGLLAMFTTYLLKNKVPSDKKYFEHKTMIMKKFTKSNRKKLKARTKSMNDMKKSNKK